MVVAVVVVVAPLVAAGAALAAALAMPPWRTATPRHLPWYALLLQALMQSHGQLMSGTLGSLCIPRAFLDGAGLFQFCCTILAHA